MGNQSFHGIFSNSSHLSESTNFVFNPDKAGLTDPTRLAYCSESGSFGNRDSRKTLPVLHYCTFYRTLLPKLNRANAVSI